MSAVKLRLLYRELHPWKSQPYGYLNKTLAILTSVDKPVWMRKVSWATSLDEELPVINYCLKRET